MRNRFEQYIPSEYISQFVATPLDTGMMYQAMKERQGVYDQLSSADINPKFEYLRPTDYDRGHQEKADFVKNYYSQESAEIARMLEEDDLAGAQNRMMRAVKNPDMLKHINFMQNAYNQYNANVEQIGKIKNIPDQQRLMAWYQQNRLTDRDYDKMFSAGKSAINNPLIAEDPGTEKMIHSFMSSIKANGIPVGDGSVIRPSYNADGSINGFYKHTTDGQKEWVDPNEAYKLGKAYIFSDSNVGHYVNTMKQAGYDLTPLIQNQIAAAAEAVGFTKITRDNNMLSVPEWQFGMENKTLNDLPNERVVEPTRNNFGEGSFGEVFIDPKDGKAKIQTSSDTWKVKPQKGGKAEHPGIPEYKIVGTPEEIKQLTQDFKKYTLKNPDGDVIVTYSNTTPQIPDYSIQSTENLTDEEAGKFFIGNYKNSRLTHSVEQPFKGGDDSPDVISDLSHYNVGPSSTILKSDGTTVSLEELKELGAEKFTRESITTGEVAGKVKSGRTVIHALDKDGYLVGKIYTNEEYGRGEYTPYFKAMDQISEFEKTPNKQEDIIEVDGKFYFGKKITSAMQDQNGNPIFDNSSSQTYYYPIIGQNFNSLAEAKRYLKENQGSSSQIQYDIENGKSATGLRRHILNYVDLK